MARVGIHYTLDGGMTWKPITATITGNPGFYDWTNPGVRAPRSKCKVKVVLNDAKGNIVGSAMSDGFFTIQTSP